MSSQVPAGKKFLAIIIMVIIAYIFYQFAGQSTPQLKKVNTNDIVSATLVYENKDSEQIKDRNQIVNLLEMYNQARVKKKFISKIQPAVLVYIEMNNAEIYIAGYRKDEVIIQYKSATANKQYLAKSAKLANYLNSKKSP